MIDFMVIALPRSGTTWAANWLTTDRVFCPHDPLYRVHYTDLDRAIRQRAEKRVAGISCSGLWRWLDWVNAHPARKVVLHRDRDEVNESLAELGFPLSVSKRDADALHKVESARHFDYGSLFERHDAEAIWRYLTRLPFDSERHTELVQMSVEPRFDAVKRDPDVVNRLGQELIQL